MLRTVEPCERQRELAVISGRHHLKKDSPGNYIGHLARGRGWRLCAIVSPSGVWRNFYCRRRTLPSGHGPSVTINSRSRQNVAAAFSTTGEVVYRDLLIEQKYVQSVSFEGGEILSTYCSTPEPPPRHHRRRFFRSSLFTVPLCARCSWKRG